METVYHASSSLFEFPSLDRPVRKGAHKNGALGLWCATENADYLKRFGHNVYALDLYRTSPLVMDLGEFVKLCDSHHTAEDFRCLRALYLEDGWNVVRLMEGHPKSCKQLIILDLSVIRKCRLMA